MMPYYPILILECTWHIRETLLTWSHDLKPVCIGLGPSVTGQSGHQYIHIWDMSVNRANGLVNVPDKHQASVVSVQSWDSRTAWTSSTNIPSTYNNSTIQLSSKLFTATRSHCKIYPLAILCYILGITSFIIKNIWCCNILLILLQFLNICMFYKIPCGYIL